jgi:hypothetical protein
VSDVPTSLRQTRAIEKFLSSLRVWATERRWDDVVSTDQFFAWVEEHPKVRVAPDVYVARAGTVPLDGVACTWEPGREPPRFAVEVVGIDKDQDYIDAPERYAALGCPELVVFEPRIGDDSSEPALTVFRDIGDQALTAVYRGDGPVLSRELGAWLVVQNEGDERVLRIARDALGQDLVPTQEERLEKEHALLEKERALKDKERARAEAAEARLRALERQATEKK